MVHETSVASQLRIAPKAKAVGNGTDSLWFIVSPKYVGGIAPGPLLAPHKLPGKAPPDEEAEPGTQARPTKNARIGSIVRLFWESELRA